MDFIGKIIATAACAVLLSSAPAGTPQERYIEKYASTAVREMYRSGVPASITLAQGLLESGFGLSPLAKDGNNHFGIKCHTDWKGKSMKVDDDAKDECFRVYDNADDSFRDHSDFLRYRQRYHFLFDYKITDYESWAYGLSKAGYATDPSYPKKLIKYIQEYDLGRFDLMKPSDFAKKDYSDEELFHEDNDEIINAGEVALPSSDRTAKKVKVKKVRKASSRKTRTSVAYEEPVEEVIPESPTVLEEAVLADKSSLEEFHFSMSRKIYRQNGVAFVYSVEGDTFASLAEAYGLFPDEILRYNDLSSAKPLLPGTSVYIQQKKNQTEKGLDKYIVETDGESLRDICQKFAVKEKTISKMNGFESGHILREGDTILLRK